MSCEVKIFVLLVLAIGSMIWGEWQRYRSLCGIFPSPEARTRLINCNKYLRVLKIVSLLFALMMQCVVVYKWCYLSQEVKLYTLIGVFMILVIEQLIPTRRLRDIRN